jgi:hypothetical protein
LARIASMPASAMTPSAPSSAAAENTCGVDSDHARAVEAWW